MGKRLPLMAIGFLIDLLSKWTQDGIRALLSIFTIISINRSNGHQIFFLKQKTKNAERWNPSEFCFSFKYGIHCVSNYRRSIQRGPKLTSLVARSAQQGRATFASDWRIMARASGVNLVWRIMSRKCYAQNSRTMCVMWPAYIMQMLRAPAARGACNKGCCFWTTL
jgi:hypothetical protein